MTEDFDGGERRRQAEEVKTTQRTPFILASIQEIENPFLPPQKSHISEIAVRKDMKFLHKLTDDGGVG